MAGATTFLAAADLLVVIPGILSNGGIDRGSVTTATIIVLVVLTVLSNGFGTGIAGGLLSYVTVKVLAGEHRQLSIGMYLLAIPLLYHFWTVIGR